MARGTDGLSMPLASEMGNHRTGRVDVALEQGWRDGFGEERGRQVCGTMETRPGKLSWNFVYVFSTSVFVFDSQFLVLSSKIFRFAKCV